VRIIISLLGIAFLLAILAIIGMFVPQMEVFLQLFFWLFGFVMGAIYTLAMIMLANPFWLVLFLACLALLAWLVGRKRRRWR